MKKTFAILFLLLIMIGPATAQYRKPLQSATNKNGYSEARYNIGISGGITSTYWAHFGGTQTHYNAPFNFGSTGGLVIERMFNANSSLSLEGYFAMRNTQLNYNVLNFPDSFTENNNYFRQLDVDYQEINVQAPFTYYFSSGNIRPYVFIGPRVSVPLSGKMIWQKTKIEDYGTENQHLNESYGSVDTVEMSAQNTWQWNIGLVAGAGMMCKLNVGNYYFLIKADVSAHAALAYFTFTNDSPYIHASLLNSFTYEEREGLSQNVIGAGYIDPYLLGMRFNTDATVKFTIMFPLKKQLKGACMKWGEYD